MAHLVSHSVNNKYYYESLMSSVLITLPVSIFSINTLAAVSWSAAAIKSLAPFTQTYRRIRL